MEARLMSIAEARAYLGGISRSTLHRYMKGENVLYRLKKCIIGGRVMIDKRDLDRFIDKNKSKPIVKEESA